MKYNVHVRLDCTYWGIEAKNAAKAFEIATRLAFEEGTWDYTIRRIEEYDEEDEEEALDDKK